MDRMQHLIVNIGNENVCFDVKETLGEGAFGVVTRVVDNRNVSFAVKHVYCRDIETYESIAQEVEILLTLKHANIVAMYGFDFLNSTALLIMEYCSQGTLNKRLDDPVDALIQLQWMEQLASALSYLHGNNIVHRDLKTENILLSEDNVKIADFGIACHFLCCRNGRGADSNPNTYIPEYLGIHMESFAGSPYWVAPEVFENCYTEMADIFSLGIVFYAICERQYCMFQGEKYYGSFVDYQGEPTGIGLVMYKQRKVIAPIFCCTCEKLQKLMVCMLHNNPERRINVNDIHLEINDAYLDILQNGRIKNIQDNKRTSNKCSWKTTHNGSSSREPENSCSEPEECTIGDFSNRDIILFVMSHIFIIILYYLSPFSV